MNTHLMDVFVTLMFDYFDGTARFLCVKHKAPSKRFFPYIGPTQQSCYKTAIVEGTMQRYNFNFEVAKKMVEKS